MKNIATFYDIDGTLYRDALSVELFKKLAKNGIITQSQWLDIKPIYDKWASRAGNYDDYIDKMFEIYTESIKGMNSGVLQFFANQVIKEKGNRLYKYTKEKMKWHKEQGHKVIIISGSSSELVQGLSEKIGVDDFIGTSYLTNENHEYTGEVNPMWDSKHKIESISYFTDKYDIDLENSYAYGDTCGDLTMLRAVGNPTIINPTRELLDKVITDENLYNKITTIIERKDVIYKLDIKNTNFFSL